MIYGRSRSRYLCQQPHGLLDPLGVACGHHTLQRLGSDDDVGHEVAYVFVLQRPPADQEGESQRMGAFAELCDHLVQVGIRRGRVGVWERQTKIARAAIFAENTPFASAQRLQPRHHRGVPDRCPVFVFANDDPLPMAFESTSAAASYIELIDVERGIYDEFDLLSGRRGAVYAVDGRVIHVLVSDGAVELVITSQHDIGDLRSRLAEAAGRGLVVGDPNDPLAVARTLLRAQWDSRWPQRPRWLDRRLHGDAPPAI